MKWTFRKQIKNILIYGFITTIQPQDGITSIIPNSENHYVLWDFDDIEYNNLVEELTFIANLFNLDNIVIMSDKENSYRCFSPTEVTFKKLLEIIIVTQKVDYLFFKWTVRRGYATIRLSDKKGRKKNKIIQILRHDGKYVPDFKSLKFVEYETDIG